MIRRKVKGAEGTPDGERHVHYVGEDGTARLDTEISGVTMGDDLLPRLYTAYAAAALDRYLLAVEFFKSYVWRFDTTACALSFERKRRLRGTDRLTFPVQVIGTESVVQQTWLWGWANTESTVPDKGLRLARELRGIGERAQGPLLAMPEIALSNTTNGAVFASIAAGMDGASFYYRCPYDGGALYVVVTAFPDPFKLGVLDPVARITTVFPQLLATVPPADVREAFRVYLDSYNLSVVDTRDYVAGTTAQGRTAVAFFDASNHLIDLQSQSGPPLGSERLG